jgi:hypothetical protein
MPEDNQLYMSQDVAHADVNVFNNQTWMEWIGALLLRFVYVTIKFLPFYTFSHLKRPKFIFF